MKKKKKVTKKTRGLALVLASFLAVTSAFTGATEIKAANRDGDMTEEYTIESMEDIDTIDDIETYLDEDKVMLLDEGEDTTTSETQQQSEEEQQESSNQTEESIESTSDSTSSNGTQDSVTESEQEKETTTIENKNLSKVGIINKLYINKDSTEAYLVFDQPIQIIGDLSEKITLQKADASAESTENIDKAFTAKTATVDTQNPYILKLTFDTPTQGEGISNIDGDIKVKITQDTENYISAASTSSSEESEEIEDEDEQETGEDQKEEQTQAGTEQTESSTGEESEQTLQQQSVIALQGEDEDDDEDGDGDEEEEEESKESATGYYSTRPSNETTILSDNISRESSKGGLEDTITFLDPKATGKNTITITTSDYTVPNTSFDKNSFSIDVTTSFGEKKSYEITKVSVAGTTITLTLDREIYQDDKIIVKYTPQSENYLKDIFGVKLDAIMLDTFSLDYSTVLDSRSSEVPSIDESVAPIYNESEKALYITFKDEIEIVGDDVKDYFTIKINGSVESTVTEVTKIGDNQLKLKLSQDLSYGDKIVLIYKDSDYETVPDLADENKITLKSTGNRLDTLKIDYNETPIQLYKEVGTLVRFKDTGFVFKLLDNDSLALVGRDNTESSAYFDISTGASIEEGVFKGLYLTTSTTETSTGNYTIAQIGYDNTALTGSFTLDEMITLGAKATSIKENALNNVVIESISDTSAELFENVLYFPNVKEIGTNGLALSKSSIVTTVVLTAIDEKMTETLDIDAIFGNNSSVNKVYVTDITKVESNNTNGITVKQIAEVEYSGQVKNSNQKQIIISFDKEILTKKDIKNDITVKIKSSASSSVEILATVASVILDENGQDLYINLTSPISAGNIVYVSIEGSNLIDESYQEISITDFQITNNVAGTSSSTASTNSSSNVSVSSGGGGGGSTSTTKETTTKEDSTIEDETTTSETSNKEKPTYYVEDDTFERKKLTLEDVKLPSVTDKIVVFNDVSTGHWASAAIAKLSSTGIITGMPDGSFSPDSNTKRADLALMCIRLLGKDEEEASVNFDDIDENAYYADAVGIAKEYGIVNGTSGNNFSPNADVSREDAMVMVARILKELNIKTDSSTTALGRFSDTANISDYALESICRLVNAGIINGNSGKLNPKDPITRAEIARILSSIYNIIEEEQSK